MSCYCGRNDCRHCGTGESHTIICKSPTLKEARQIIKEAKINKQLEKHNKKIEKQIEKLKKKLK